jgi:hypothetical protein
MNYEDYPKVYWYSWIKAWWHIKRGHWKIKALRDLDQKLLYEQRPKQRHFYAWAYRRLVKELEKRPLTPEEKKQ